MRSAAAQYLHDYDLRPVASDIYVTDVVDKGGKMIKALREWEQRRGIVYSFRTKFIEPKPKSKIVEEKAKPKQVKDRPIVVPRERGKPGRKPQFTKEEKRQRKNEQNRTYRQQNAEAYRVKSREWRAKLTPEQKQEIYRRHREWRAARKAASLAQQSNGTAPA